MSAIDELILAIDDPNVSYEDIQVLMIPARAELASLRAAVAGRDAAIERAVAETIGMCIACCDDGTECGEHYAAAIRARGEKVTSAKDKCERCGVNDATEPHSCPYKADINDDPDTLCTCCSECANECAMDI